MNTLAKHDFDAKRKKGSFSAFWKPVSKQEFQIFVALFSAAASLKPKGKSLWIRKDSSNHHLLFSCPARFDRFMLLKRFKEIRAYAFYVFADLDAKDKKDKWWPVLEIEKSYGKK